MMNIFPGPGGVENVTNTLVRELECVDDVFILAFSAIASFSVPKSLDRKVFYFKGRDVAGNIAYYNEIINRCRITHVINQGIYFFLSDIVFNKERDRGLKIISVLHGMAGYEKEEYWCQDRVRSAGSVGIATRKILGFFGLNNGFIRYVRRFAEAYAVAVRESYKVVLLSDEDVTLFCSYYHFDCDRSKIIAIPNPLPENYSDVRQPDFGQKEDIMLYAGRLAPVKNIPDILRAWKIFAKRAAGWKLIIVGDGPSKADLEKAARKMQNVEFVGYTANPEMYYRRAKTILLTSKLEGYPMTLIEARRFGVVPVVYDICPGVRSIVSEGCGIITKGKNARALAEAMSLLAGNKEMLEAMSASAYLASYENCLQTIMEKWKNIL